MSQTRESKIMRELYRHSIFRQQGGQQGKQFGNSQKHFPPKKHSTKNVFMKFFFGFKPD
jgi:hypothetical protein